MYKNKKGFALTEVLLAIAVIVIIGIGAYSLYTNAKNTAQIDQIMNTLVEIDTGITKMVPTGRWPSNGPQEILQVLVNDGLIAEPAELATVSGADPGSIYYKINGVTYFATVEDTASGQYAFGIVALPPNENSNKICNMLLPRILAWVPPDTYITIGSATQQAKTMSSSQNITYCSFYSSHSSNLEIDIQYP